MTEQELMRIEIPEEIVHELNWKEGDNIELKSVSPDELVFVRADVCSVCDGVVPYEWVRSACESVYSSNSKFKRSEGFITMGGNRLILCDTCFKDFNLDDYMEYLRTKIMSDDYVEGETNEQKIKKGIMTDDERAEAERKRKDYRNRPDVKLKKKEYDRQRSLKKK